MSSYIGIDLGQKGAITIQSIVKGKPKFEIIPFWHRYGGTRLRTYTDNEYVDLITEAVSDAANCFVAVEHPVFMPKNGKKAIASLHENFGLTKGILIGLGVESFWYPKPVQWKTVVSAKGNDKSLMTKLASRLTRHKNLNDMTSDSVLISEACRLHFRS